MSTEQSTRPASFARPALRAWEAMIDNGTAMSDPAAFDAACRAAADEERAAIRDHFTR